MSSDIRKWFMKTQDKGAASGAAKPSGAAAAEKKKPVLSIPEKKPAPPSLASCDHDPSARRKTSKYFGSKAEKDSDVEMADAAAGKSTDKSAAKRKLQKGSNELKDGNKPLPAKKMSNDDKDDDDDFVAPSKKKTPVKPPPSKKPKVEPNVEAPGRTTGTDDGEEDDKMDEDTKTPSKGAGRGRGRGGGRGGGAAPGGRGRGGGGRGFMNFGERKDPPHKGEKEVPEGAPDCLSGLTFVISGTLDSLEREEATDLIKRYGGRVTGSISKKTSYLLADEDIGGVKSNKAKDLGVPFLTEDGLFDLIRKSKPAKAPVDKHQSNNGSEKLQKSQTKSSPARVDKRAEASAVDKSIASKSNVTSASAENQKAKKIDRGSMQWTEKYRPKVPNDIVGNQSMVKQLHDWLKSWDTHFRHSGQKGKGKKPVDSGAKKAVLLSGPPGIGKTTTAKVVSQMLGLQAIEVNASDSRGKADSKIEKDRGGVADLIASIKISKIPIICICNDRYSQKLKSLVNYCLMLNFRKPTKQQMGKRLMEIAKKEGIQAQENAMEELAERVHGDIRMALNHLQYMSLSQSVVKYDDIRVRLNSSTKDEDISPFTAVDKLFGFNGGRLRMDERIDYGMSDPDLVPLIIQENYINYRPNTIGKDESGVKRMNALARAAESIADGDLVNVQIRRYRQWQLSQAACFASSIVPLIILENCRETLRLDYLTLLLRQLTDPLKTMPKDEAVQKVVEFMDTYSLSQEDFDTIVEISKFKGHPSPMDGIQPAVKSALTKAYKQGSSSRVVRAADLINIPGMKKPLKKRVAAILEPVEESLPDENGVASAEADEEDSSDAENNDELVPGDSTPKLDLKSDKKKGIQVQLDLKSNGKDSGGKKTPAARSRGPGSGGKAAGSSAGKRKSSFVANHVECLRLALDVVARHVIADLYLI
ncbi:replication factor C subunit 1 [Panicum miliaceum]|uniref:Replication factor C subunit 1 n=1 Tax=Panicum miliaceum TaxID=4540 RepID=A0A3L6Q410_PANMI|nr:replication factor C subunit 1 [Panicum miliaceum]